MGSGHGEGLEAVDEWNVRMSKSRMKNWLSVIGAGSAGRSFVLSRCLPLDRDRCYAVCGDWWNEGGLVAALKIPRPRVRTTSMRRGWKKY